MVLGLPVLTAARGVPRWRTGAAGHRLKLKTQPAMQEGWIEPVEGIRTKHEETQRVVEIVAERVKGRSPVRLAVTQASSEAVMDPLETMCVPTSPVIDMHAGPGTVTLNLMCSVT